MLVHRSIVRSIAATATAVGLTASGLVIAASPAQAAAPGNLNANVRNASTAILSWSAVKNAEQYEVQVDNADSFSSPEFASKTTNTKAVPAKALIPGKNFWRVRAILDDDVTSWASGSFTMAPVTTPIPVAPADGAVLPQPQSPPLLQWSSSQGAVSYTVAVDGDADMIGAKIYSTKTTSLVVPDPLTTGDWYWQVTAVKGTGLVSLPSAIARFDIQAVQPPQITSPANDINQAVEDVVLDWEPVPGARTYDVQVALDQGFNFIQFSAEGVQGSRISPVTTLANDQFWWRVRAVDLAGQPTPWRESLFSFQRQWLDQPQPVFPTGTVATDRPYIQWTPVQHASYYELYVANNSQMTGAAKCTTVGTTYVLRNPGDCGIASGVDLWWEVRAMDEPYGSAGLPGVFSVPQPFRLTYSLPAAGAIDLDSSVTGLKVSVGGTGVNNLAAGCVDPLADPNTSYICDGVPTTPVFSWDPVPGATTYHIDVAQDVNFTTSVMNNGINTKFTSMALRAGDQAPTLPETQAGSAYYWHVTACGTNGCMQSPVSRNPPLPGSEAFRKASPAVVGLSTSNTNASEISFSWQDYYDTNVNTAWGPETGTQTAQRYRIQVSPDPSFSAITDQRTVDQASYTAFDRLYADGTYFWRVQAIDNDGNALAWSAVQSFTKTSPAVAPSSPVGGVQVPGTIPFRWEAAPFAASYTVEVYRNNDLSFSQANRVFSATVKTAAYAPSSPIPAAGTPYVWRVRRQDASGNPGPWSSPQTFFSTGVAPNLLSPKAGIWLRNAGALFEWTEVPGAASYALNVGGTKPFKVTTVATAYAPGAQVTGKYTWNVTAYDGAGNPLATSATRQYNVDATPPQVKRLKPAALKSSSVLKAIFTERVKGISEKSIKLYRLKGAKRVLVKSKVKVLKRGKAASIDPKGSLRRGEYVLVFRHKKIRDLRGNLLVPTKIELKR